MAVLTFNTAMRLLSQNNHQAVYDLAVTALRENEKNPMGFFFLGMLASEHGQHDKALELFAKASEHGPSNARYQAFHAKALMTMGFQAEAKSQADRAVKLRTKDAFVTDIIGTVYSRAGHHELAVPLFKQAAKLNPNWALFQYNLGASAQFIGDIKAAKSAYLQAVKIDPNFYRAWFSLVSLETQSRGNNHLTKLESLFSKAMQDGDGQLLIGHAIAKTLEDMDKFPESLEWLKKAKAIRKTQVRFDESAMKAMFTAAKTIKDRAQSNPKSDTDITPVFIVGLPRTGTTLIDRILSSHANVMSVGELDRFTQIVENAVQISRMQFGAFFTAAGSADSIEIGKHYKEQIQSLAGKAKYVIDKTPTNFLYAGLIHKALPNARIIAVRRGAMDSCLSNYRQLFALHERRYDYAFDLDNTAQYYREFDRLMNHWRQALPKSRFMEIGYEEIINNQEIETRRLLEFCSLDWDPVCLQFHENTAPVDTASSIQVRQPLYASSVGRWKKYGSQLDSLKNALGSLADQ